MSDSVRYVKKSNNLSFLTKNKVYMVLNEMISNEQYSEIQIMNDFGQLMWICRSRFVDVEE